MAGLWATVSHAQITNDITVTGTYGGAQVQALDDENVSVVPATPRVQLTKTIDQVIDTNGSGRVDAGDTVIYRFEVRNTGNQTLQTIELTDPMVSFSTSTLGPLLPLESDASLTANYILEQLDLDAGGVENSAEAEATPPDDINGDPQAAVTDISDAGDETVETPSLDGSFDSDPTNDPTVLELQQIVEMDVQKSLVDLSQPFPFVFDLTYRIGVENLGNVTATELVLSDDVATQFAPSIVMAASLANPTGDIDAADLNSGFDGGASDANLLGAGIDLAPSERFEIDIVVRVEVPPSVFTGGVASLENSGRLDLDESPTSFPTLNGGNPGPVTTDILDEDLDGVVDAEEVAGDRDGDGTGDTSDYDPTGYLYCEEDGSILSGGSISVTSLTGTSAAIRTVEDGSTGFYQWYVTEAGTYQMTFTNPPNVQPSIDRLPAGTLQTSTFGGDTISLGSNEDGASGVLADFSAGANPYHLIFQIDEGDPHVLNNNIPFRFCGTPAISVSKNVLGAPILRPDGTFELTYFIQVTNTGNSRATDIGLTDPLIPVFGAGNFTVVSNTIAAAPATFTGTANGGYNGASDIALLTPGGFLEPGDRISLEVSLNVTPTATGVYENTATATGRASGSGDPLPDAEGSVGVFLTFAELQEDLRISKTASPERVQVGDVVTYSIEVENTAPFAISGIDLIDELPFGLQYRSGTAELDGVPDEPQRVARRLIWEDFPIGAGQTREMTLQTLVGPSAGPGDITNNAWIVDGTTGERLTRIASATVRIVIEPVFDCSTVIGKVFDDRNLNGYQDPPPDARAQISDQTYYGDKAERQILKRQQEFGEPGIPNVKVLTPTGTVITTDEFGRFSVPCAELPERMGTNFSLKVDERSLPTGYHVVTENPRTMRLTAGIFAEMNFGASLGDVIDIKLTSEAFDPAGRPVAALRENLRKLRAQVGDTHTLINLSYYYRSEGAAEARRRLDALEALFKEVWRGTGRNSLEIERSIFDAR